jgi:hypothetical protein
MLFDTDFKSKLLNFCFYPARCASFYFSICDTFPYLNYGNIISESVTTSKRKYTLSIKFCFVNSMSV